MKHISLIAAAMLLIASCAPKEKEIYVPKDLQTMDLKTCRQTVSVSIFLLLRASSTFSVK